MRAAARLAFAITASALLHVAVFVVPDHVKQAHRAGGHPLQVRVLSTHSGAVPVVVKAAPPAEASVAPPVPDPAPPIQSSMPAWLAALSRETDPIYYASNEVEMPAVPLAPIDLNEDLSPVLLQDGRATLEIKIDEFGVVDSVAVLAASPPTLQLDDTIASFRSMRFSPAVLSARYVKSRKVVEVCFGNCGVPASLPLLTNDPAPSP